MKNPMNVNLMDICKMVAECEKMGVALCWSITPLTKQELSTAQDEGKPRNE